ncbi:protein of unknown function [Candidatus Methylomirabilis oxygeniifera]|uniref:Uncharacterized protein n=1 Tax=Methylomirabilis oxygeniifera TaxID=671143 RepID=D5MJY3_METO1|nr:protein of unknown function [Candidatus Methylomirabilis oxyfera]
MLTAKMRRPRSTVPRVDRPSDRRAGHPGPASGDASVTCSIPSLRTVKDDAINTGVATRRLAGVHLGSCDKVLTADFSELLSNLFVKKRFIVKLVSNSRFRDAIQRNTVTFGLLQGGDLLQQSPRITQGLTSKNQHTLHLSWPDFRWLFGLFTARLRSHLLPTEHFTQKFHYCFSFVCAGCIRVARRTQR